MQRILFLCLLVWCLGGCTIGPDYRQPEVDTPDSWRLSEQDGRELADTVVGEFQPESVLGAELHVHTRTAAGIRYRGSEGAERDSGRMCCATTHLLHAGIEHG